MPQPKSRPTTFGRQSHLFGLLAATAVTISLIAVMAQLVLVAAPLWKDGPIVDTIIGMGKQLFLSAPALFYVVGLGRARRVFRRIGRGELFEKANAEGLVSIGWFLLVGALWAIAAAGLEPVVAEQTISYVLHAIGAAAAELALAALGLAIIMIGKVMNAAASIKAENDEFV
jgi:hypothetical protein